jgi:hypothetical protein
MVAQVLSDKDTAHASLSRGECGGRLGSLAQKQDELLDERETVGRQVGKQFDYVSLHRLWRFG